MPKNSKKRDIIDSSDSDDSLPAEERNPPAKKPKTGEESKRGDDGSIYWNLEGMKRVSVRNFKGKCYVDIREFYEKDGKTMPGKKGISLTKSTFKKLMSLSGPIEDAVEQMM